MILLLANSNSYGQTADTTTHSKEKLFHDRSTYIDFQFPKGDKPLITTQLWTYVKKAYFEARYNYEDRETFSLYGGRSFKVGKNNELDIIPMVGGSVGKFNGVSPALTIILEAGWVRGFSQNQYSINLKEQKSNFIFDWSAIVFHTYKPLYLGASFQSFAPQNTKAQNYFGPMVSVKDNHIIVEGFAYNFWTDAPMWALGLQYLF